VKKPTVMPRSTRASTGLEALTTAARVHPLEAKQLITELNLSLWGLPDRTSPVCTTFAMIASASAAAQTGSITAIRRARNRTLPPTELPVHPRGGRQQKRTKRDRKLGESERRTALRTAASPAIMTRVLKSRLFAT